MKNLMFDGRAVTGTVGKHSGRNFVVEAPALESGNEAICKNLSAVVVIPSPEP